MRPNLFLNLGLLMRMLAKICSSKSSLSVETMLSIRVRSSWEPQRVRKLPLYSIQAQNILLWPVFFAMTKHQETSNLRNTTHFLGAFKRAAIPAPKDAKQWHITCINHSHRRWCQRHQLSWHMDLLRHRDSSGRIIHASTPFPKDWLKPHFQPRLRNKNAHYLSS